MTSGAAQRKRASQARPLPIGRAASPEHSRNSGFLQLGNNRRDAWFLMLLGFAVFFGSWLPFVPNQLLDWYYPGDTLEQMGPKTLMWMTFSAVSLGVLLAMMWAMAVILFCGLTLTLVDRYRRYLISDSRSGVDMFSLVFRQ